MWFIQHPHWWIKHEEMQLTYIVHETTHSVGLLTLTPHLFFHFPLAHHFLLPSATLLLLPAKQNTSNDETHSSCYDPGQIRLYQTLQNNWYQKKNKKRGSAIKQLIIIVKSFQDLRALFLQSLHFHTSNKKNKANKRIPYLSCISLRFCISWVCISSMRLSSSCRLRRSTRGKKYTLFFTPPTC